MLISPYVTLLMITVIGLVFPPLLFVALPLDVLFIWGVIQENRRVRRVRKERAEFDRWYAEKSRYVS